MTPSIMLFDNFYANPTDVRNFALSMDFNISGNFPGFRTKPLDGENNKNAKLLMENIIKKKIVWWPEEYNTAFQYTTENDETWIHYDPTNWAAVLYLTPDAPLDSGTAIYMHNETKIYMLDRNDPKTDLNQYGRDLTQWTPIAKVSNIFNRLVVYRGNYYHRSVKPGFGQNQHNGRLFQTFFFNTED
jgi:hypothetical protein